MAAPIEPARITIVLQCDALPMPDGSIASLPTEPDFCPAPKQRHAHAIELYRGPRSHDRPRDSASNAGGLVQSPDRDSRLD